jgi:hypothetical protein
MAYPEGKMPAHIREWYCSHWGRELEEKELFEEEVKLMRWFAKPFSKIEFTRAGAVTGEIARTARIMPRVARKASKQREGAMGCKTAAVFRSGDNEEGDDARGDAPKGQMTGQFSAAVSTRKRASGDQSDASGKSKTEKKASSGHNHTEGADVTSPKPTLLTLPWSIMEKIYTAKEGEFSARDIPGRDELDRHLRRLAKERHHAPGMYHLYLVSD